MNRVSKFSRQRAVYPTRASLVWVAAATLSACSIRFVDDADVQLIGVEAGGRGDDLGEHAARFDGGVPGVFQGTASYVLQNTDGQVIGTHSVSAGLDYPSVGPEHAWLRDIGRASYRRCSDTEALAGFHLLAETEGIIPALESAHAIGKLAEIAHEFPEDAVIVVNVSGRGDKDIGEIARLEGEHMPSPDDAPAM